MKAVKKVLLAMMAAAVALCVVAVPALAEENYTYTVRLFAGNHGTVDGGEVTTLGTDYAQGDVVTLSRDMVTLEPDSKYYVKGFRISGQDDLVSAVTVNGDTDVVVAYGVEGEMVSYTVHFVVEATGEELGSATFTGKVGDKPVESYEYFEGYRPLYRNITGTLTAGGNDWTLPYVVEEAPETVVTETTTVTTENVVTTPAPAAAAGAAAAAPAAEGAAAPEGAAAAAPGAEAAATPEATAPATEEILDVDNPLAGPDGQGTEGQGQQGQGSQGQQGQGTEGQSENIGENENPTAGAASIVGNNWVVILLVAALGAGAYFLLRRKNDEPKNAE